ncbi:hypothetical protein cand_013920 [Cryptosporidium andersoni]|uniref:Vacuolar protein sorting-associated protein 54 C-terminal domain-containing protein n=1 Tax=Cryptosporidium andersoni TaxID=117008 RepID=A0A1J4MUF3_9CRYT|nr:hypothetical protein cand_013920 [Cryptosporidium andersoni]
MDLIRNNMVNLPIWIKTIPVKNIIPLSLRNITLNSQSNKYNVIIQDNDYNSEDINNSDEEIINVYLDKYRDEISKYILMSRSSNIKDMNEKIKRVNLDKEDIDFVNNNEILIQSEFTGEKLLIPKKYFNKYNIININLINNVKSEDEIISYLDIVGISLYEHLSNSFNPLLEELRNLRLLEESLNDLLNILLNNKEDNSNNIKGVYNELSFNLFINNNKKDVIDINNSMINTKLIKQKKVNFRRSSYKIIDIFYKLLIKKRIFETIKKLRIMSKLRKTQNILQVLLNNKQYDEANSLIDDTLDILNKQMDGIISLSTLSSQLIEIYSVIDKISAQDFISMTLSWIEYPLNSLILENIDENSFIYILSQLKYIWELITDDEQEIEYEIQRIGNILDKVEMKRKEPIQYLNIDKLDENFDGNCNISDLSVLSNNNNNRVKEKILDMKRLSNNIKWLDRIYDTIIKLDLDLYMRFSNELNEDLIKEFLSKKYFLIDMKNTLFHPIIALLKRGRIALALDDLDTNLNQLLDKVMNNLLSECNDLDYMNFKLKENLNKEEISEILKEDIKIIKGFNFSLFITQRLSIFAMMIIVIYLNLVNRNDIPQIIINKSIQQVHIPIKQWLEQNITRIFCNFINLVGFSTKRMNKYLDIINISSLYWISVKSMCSLYKIQETITNTWLLNIQDQIKMSSIKQNNDIDDYNNSNDSILNLRMFERVCSEIRIQLYTLYRSEFEDLYKIAWDNLSQSINSEMWERNNLYQRYKKVFQLFLTGELGNEQSISISNYSIIYKDIQFSISSCCLDCIETVAYIIKFIHCIPLISPEGISRLSKLLRNYLNTCFNYIVKGEAVKKGYLKKISVYNLAICGQDIYFWSIAISNISEHIVKLLTNRDLFYSKKILNKSDNDSVYSKNNGCNVSILLGLESLVSKETLIYEIENIVQESSSLKRQVFYKISDILIERFSFCLINWISDTSQNIDNFEFKDNLIPSLANIHVAHNSIIQFIKDTQNLYKTLNKYLKIYDVIKDILQRSFAGFVEEWTNYLNNHEFVKRNYHLILLDLLYIHNSMKKLFKNKLDNSDNIMDCNFVLELIKYLSIKLNINITNLGDNSNNSITASERSNILIFRYIEDIILEIPK